MYIRQHHSQPWAQRPGGLVRSGRVLPPVHACVHGRRQATIFASLPTDGRRGQPATLGLGILVVTPSPCVITGVLKNMVRLACTDSASTPLSLPNPAPLQIPPPPAHPYCGMARPAVGETLFVSIWTGGGRLG